MEYIITWQNSKYSVQVIPVSVRSQSLMSKQLCYVLFCSVLSCYIIQREVCLHRRAIAEEYCNDPKFFRTDRSGQAVQTQIRLLLLDCSYCLLFNWYDF